MTGEHWVPGLGRDDGWYALLVDRAELTILRVHPVPFASRPDAVRGVAWLNGPDQPARWD